MFASKKLRTQALVSSPYLLIMLVCILVLTSVNAEGKCSGFSQKSIATEYVTPFGLVSSNTGNFQYFGVVNCAAYGGYVSHAQRFNGGRDNTIVGGFYRVPINEKLSFRVALDNLDVNQPSFEVSRLRLKLVYAGELNYSAEYFNFFNGKDQRVLLWSLGDTYQLDSGGNMSWKVGGSFHTGFGLQDRYYAEAGYQKNVVSNWFWQVRYQYQHQPEQINIATLDVIYKF